MPSVVLSQPMIDAGLEPGDYFDRALPNFGVRVRPGRAYYFVRVREAGKRPRLELGPATGLAAVKLKAARQDAATKLRQHDEGKILRPPIVPAEALAAGALDAETITVAQLVEAFLGCQGDASRPWSPSHASNQAFMARRIVIPAWGELPARSVTRLQVKTLTRTYAKQAATNANRLHAFLSRLFRWALSEESGGGEPLLEKNPMDQMKKPTTEIDRERELTPAEIVVLFAALDKIDADERSTPRDRALAALWRLRLLTAQREQSLRRLEWTNVNLEDNVIEIPGLLMKGKHGEKRPHVVPLGTRAKAILEARQAAASPLDRFVFGTREGTNAAPGRPRGVPVAFDNFQGHDLRRTATTLMTSHGITDFVVARVLAHKDKSVTGIYNRYQYLPEKRVALELLDRLVSTILETDASKQAKVLAFVKAS